MPVGRPEELQDGKPARVYRGRSDLGQLGEWACPGCGAKHTTKFELGCPSCGAGTPGKAGQVPEPPAKGAARGKDQPAKVEQGRVSPPPDRPMPAGPSLAPPPLSGAVQTVYRLIKYVAQGPAGEAWLHETLQRSLVGTIQVGPPGCAITGGVVDDVSSRQQDILGLIGRQPGVWLGNPTLNGRQVDRTLPITSPQDNPLDLPRTLFTARGVAEYHTAPTGNIFEQAAQERERMAEPREVSPEVSLLAAQITELGGYRLAYTLAMALQMFAEQVAVGTLEAEKHYTQNECLQLAQALLNTVPEDWQPETPAEES